MRCVTFTHEVKVSTQQCTSLTFPIIERIAVYIPSLEGAKDEAVASRDAKIATFILIILPENVTFGEVVVITCAARYSRGNAVLLRTVR